jgi:AraC family transcriptional regulator
MIQHKLQLESLPDMHVACTSYKGNYIGNAEIFKNLIETLMGWAGPKGLISEKMTLFSSYPDDYESTKPEDMMVEVCIPVPETTRAEGDVQTKTQPGGNYAVMDAELAGPPEYAEAWTAIVKWAEENNVKMDTSRPSYEFYLNNPAEHPENHHLVRICLSVK